MTKRTGYFCAIGLGLFGVLLGACGGDDEVAPVGVRIDRQTMAVVLDNRTETAIELSVSAEVACAQVGRNDVVDLDTFMLAAKGVVEMPLLTGSLELERSGNEQPCEVRPIAMGRIGTEMFTFRGRMIRLDADGRLLPDDRELSDGPRCGESTRCTDRK